jgi:formylglycine-generating enzyme required for sulfatase activity
LYKTPDSEPVSRGALLVGLAVLVLAAAGWWFFSSTRSTPPKNSPPGSETASQAAQNQETAREQPRMESVGRGSEGSHEMSPVSAAPIQELKVVDSTNQSPAPAAGAPTRTPQPGATPAALEKPRGAEEGRPWTVPDLNLEMVYIHPGGFTMGSPDSEKGRYKNESPQTQVTLTKGYWLGKTAVTQGQWEALMAGNPSNVKGADHPVERVSWDDAMEFCLRLTERERAAGRLADGYVYTLPTEAQWEYACRAGTTGPYSGADNLDNLGWYSLNSGGTSHPVGQKQPNAWGLYDMHGNVGQWCRDWFGDYPGGSVTDPAGPAMGSFRVDRGGSCSLPARFCRSAFRRRLEPGSHENNLGFRLALAPAP